MSIAELAAKMGAQKSYLYRVMPALEKERKVRRDAGTWHPR
jgi:DNA-binding IclR family transcriptional regulator